VPTSINYRSRTALALALVLLVASGRVSAGDAVPPWRWFGPCDSANTMNIEVSLDGGVLFTATVRVCRTDVQEPHTLSFKFSAPRTIVWAGYRDEDFTTAQGLPIRGDLWLAGGESGGLTLGVSFVDDTSKHAPILMNTLHFASVTSSSASDITSGLMVKTTPNVHGAVRSP
jgi:hypothetical protein